MLVDSTVSPQGIISHSGNYLHSVFLVGAQAPVEAEPVHEDRPPAAVVAVRRPRRRRGTVEEYGVGPNQFTAMITAFMSFKDKGLVPLKDFWAEVSRLGFSQCSAAFFTKHKIVELRHPNFRVLREVTARDRRQYTKEYENYLEGKKARRERQATKGQKAVV